MKLYYTKRSPYASKVRAVALELGIQLQLIEVDLANKPAELINANPLGKIPTLVLDNGETIFDSPVICQYLVNIVKNSNLIPSKNPEQTRVLTIEAAADGVMDSCVAIFMENIRDEQHRSPKVIERHIANVHHALQYFERNIKLLEGNLHLGAIAVASALGYINFRFSDKILWESEYPNLQKWYKQTLNNKAIIDTTPRVA